MDSGACRELAPVLFLRPLTWTLKGPCAMGPSCPKWRLTLGHPLVMTFPLFLLHFFPFPILFLSHFPKYLHTCIKACTHALLCGRTQLRQSCPSKLGKDDTRVPQVIDNGKGIQAWDSLKTGFFFLPLWYLSSLHVFSC